MGVVPKLPPEIFSGEFQVVGDISKLNPLKIHWELFFFLHGGFL